MTKKRKKSFITFVQDLVQICRLSRVLSGSWISHPSHLPVCHPLHQGPGPQNFFSQQTPSRVWNVKLLWLLLTVLHCTFVYLSHSATFSQTFACMFGEIPHCSPLQECTISLETQIWDQGGHDIFVPIVHSFKGLQAGKLQPCTQLFVYKWLSVTNTWA